MKNLTPQQILRVFALYIGAQAVYTNTSGYSIERNVDSHTISRIEAGRHELYKLILRQLSAITDEDAVQVARILDIEPELLGDKDSFVEAFFDQSPGFMIDAYRGAAYFWVAQYLIQRGYSVPVFIESGHPDNGKTAIELGLAVDAATLNQ